MAGIAFFFEDENIDVYSGHLIDLGVWNLAAKLAGDITKLLVVNHTQLQLVMPDADINFTVVTELPELENAAFMTPDRGIPLWDIDHSKVDWYVFGPAGGWDNKERDYINIPQNGMAHCHSAHVVQTVMFHRYASF